MEYATLSIDDNVLGSKLKDVELGYVREYSKLIMDEMN